MSALDAFFNKQFFRASKCKTLLKLTIPRIKLLKNRREMQVRQMRKEMAKLLETGQEATARVRVEHIIREENMMAVQEILELFCELIVVRLPIIEAQRECPLDLKEAISSICFAAPRCADLSELQQVQLQFAAKYGKEFVEAACELLPNCGVNRKVIEFLSIRAPPAEVKIKLLKEIAEEHGVEWDPSATESELLELHEDLLNGPGAFINGSTLPLPEEKYKESLLYPPAKHDLEQENERDTGLEALDLPAVPKASVHAVPTMEGGKENISNTSEPEIISSLQAMPPSGMAHTQEKINSTFDSVPQTDLCLHTPPSFTVDVKEKPKQFVPFVSSLPTSCTLTHEAVSSLSIPSPTPSILTQINTEVQPNHNLIDALVNEQAEEEASKDIFSKIPVATQSQTVPQIPLFTVARMGADDDLNVVLAAAQDAAETAESAATAARVAANLVQVRITERTMKRSGKTLEKSGVEDLMYSSSQTGPIKKYAGVVEMETDDDFNDILTAAKAAAETAERAATVTRMSANLAQARITELTMKRKCEVDNLMIFSSETSPAEKFSVDGRHLAENLSPPSLLHEIAMADRDSHQFNRLSSRSPSMEDDPYDSYPNLFSNQDSDFRSARDSSP